ncbi:MAG: GNAT family N-acetyltransferase [Myxococcales bacterium]|nr:GNAT family N-acetyltransferase [Myxococcales bacterium]
MPAPSAPPPHGLPPLRLPAGWTLRLAGPHDSVAIAHHIASIYAEFDLGFNLEFEDDLIDVAASYQHGAFWIVEAPQHGAARIEATAAVLPHGGSRVFKRLYVAPTARRTGVARALLHAAHAWGDFVRTELWSDVRFQNAHQLYLSAGFMPGPVRVLEDPDRSVERSFWCPTSQALR